MPAVHAHLADDPLHLGADELRRAAGEHADRVHVAGEADPARRRLSRPGPFQDWVDRATLHAELEDWLAGRRAIGLQVWRWLSLEAWSHRFVARDPRVLAREEHVPPDAGRHLGVVEAGRVHERSFAAPDRS